MPLGDLPVVRAGVARRARVGEHDSLLELSRVDVERDPPDAVHPELDGRDAAVQRGTVVLHAGRHADRLALDVHRDLQQALSIRSAPGPARQGAARRDGQRRRAGDAGAGRRFAARGERGVLEPVVTREERQQRQLARAVEVGPVPRRDLTAGVDRPELDASVVSSIDLDVRAQADRRVERRRRRRERDRAARCRSCRPPGRCASVRKRECSRRRGIEPFATRRIIVNLQHSCRRRAPPRRSASCSSPGSTGRRSRSNCESLAREFGLGGVILFARNIAEPEQVAELSLRGGAARAGDAAWVSVDQEGGRVARLKAPFTEWPPMATLGRSGDCGWPSGSRARSASELRAVGITLDYAPVLDIHTNPKNPVIGDRALAEKAERGSRGSAAAIVRGLQGEGVAACGKHFPGHGDTSADSHLELPLVEHPPERLREVEFVPFKAAIEARRRHDHDRARAHAGARRGAAGHAVAARVITDLLREELGFEGVILSDDLEMKAIASRYAVPAAAVLAIEAGCDGVLICSGDHDTQAASARGADPRGREVSSCRWPAWRMRSKRQRRAKERFLRRRVAGRGLSGQGAATAARPGRASRHRRRDGAVRLMVKPRALAPGDRLAVVAPASPFKREEFDAGVAEIRRLGFVPVYDESVFASGSGIVAGPAAVRAGAIRKAWRIPTIAGIVAVRGGYGSAQVLPLLDRQKCARACKPFIGYSDLTALLTFLTLHCELVAFHGPMLAGRLGRGAAGYDRDSFERALCRRSRWASCAAGARSHPAGRGARAAVRRDADAAARVARHAVRLQSAARARAVSRRGRRAAVSTRSHGDAAAAGRRV